MVKHDDRIPLDLAQFNGKQEAELDFSDFVLSEKEVKSFYDLVDLGDSYLSGYLTHASGFYTVTIEVSGTIHLKDVHDGSIREYDIDDDVDVVIAPEDPDSNEIEPDDDGIYDLRGAILALLYSCIPTNYSEVPLTTIKTDDYVIMSEEEYMKSRAKNDAFSALDDLDLNE